MQNDEIIWQVINQGFCKYKAKLETKTFCTNEYNLTGLCNRSSCPLANSRYATVLEKDGICYLYMKTIERAHMPAQLWERIKLKENYAEALKQIDENLAYWPNFIKHKAKQRLTKIRQYLIRMRKLRKKVTRKLVGIHKKVERREANREKKAEGAARIDQKVKEELLRRLTHGVYSDDIVNVEHEFQKILEEEAEPDVDHADEDELEGDEEAEDEEEAEGDEDRVFVDADEVEGADFSDLEDWGEEELEEDGELGELEADEEDDDEEEDDESDESDEAPAPAPAPPKKRKAPPAPPQRQRRAKVSIEYELENEPTAVSQTDASTDF